MSACSVCGATVSGERCPACGVAISVGSLMMARGVGAESAITRDAGEALLARAEEALALELDRDLGGALALSELYPALDKMEPKTPDLGQLERMLDLGEQAEVHGIALASLLDPAGQGPKILKRGIVFLRKGRFSEAVEWWSLHRAELSGRDAKLDLLLLMMEMLTRELAGDRGKADAALARVKAHPLFRRLTGRGEAT